MTEQEKQFFDALKPGDEVALSTSRSHAPTTYALAKVSHITPTGIVVCKRKVGTGERERVVETRFNPDGRERGGGPWYPERLYDPVVIAARAAKQQAKNKRRRVVHDLQQRLKLSWVVDKAVENEEVFALCQALAEKLNA